MHCIALASIFYHYYLPSLRFAFRVTPKPKTEDTSLASIVEVSDLDTHGVNKR